MADTLCDMWKNNRNYLTEKTIAQILKFAGDGNLKDNSNTSKELREYFSMISTEYLAKYISQCLSSTFDDSGGVLQDLINEVGSRLGYKVEFGLYRGRSNAVGFDGIWEADGHSIVVEAKTTDAYQIEINTVAQYRTKLISQERIKRDKSSILIIVGRTNASGLEDQIRGSRHAWDIRLISVHALLQLLKLKEEYIDNEHTFRQVTNILKPLEFFRLDNLIDAIYNTGVESRETSTSVDENQDAEQDTAETDAGQSPVTFNDKCAVNVGKYLGVELKKQTRSLFVNELKKVAVTCSVSKVYNALGAPLYWFAFHSYQRESLEKYDTAYVSFGCENSETIALFKLSEFVKYLKDFSITVRENRKYWHIKIEKRQGKFFLLRGNKSPVDITDKIIKVE